MIASAKNSIEFKPLLQKQLSRDFDILWSAGEWLASIIISAPGFWRQAEAEIPGRGGGYGGQQNRPCRFSGRRTNASSSRSSDEHPQACLVLLIGGGNSRRARTFWGGQDFAAARRCGS